MTPTRPCARHRLALMLLPLTLAACATRSPAPPLPPPELPSPPAALMSDSSVTDWQDYSQRARNWLQRARQQVIELLPPPPGCNATSPRSAGCL